MLLSSDPELARTRPVTLRHESDGITMGMVVATAQPSKPSRYVSDINSRQCGDYPGYTFKK